MCENNNIFTARKKMNLREKTPVLICVDLQK